VALVSAVTARQTFQHHLADFRATQQTALPRLHAH
jgi:hypothetical protein